MTGKTAKILVAGVGNVLQGDDGFGIEVANRLMLQEDLQPLAKIIETGIGGMSLVQELMTGYDALLLLDAFGKGGKPGQLYLLEPELPDLSALDAHQLRDYFSDTHYATPLRALNLLKHISTLPATIRIIGCEPAQLHDLHLGLSPAVSASVDKAVAMAINWIHEYRDAHKVGAD